MPAGGRWDLTRRLKGLMAVMVVRYGKDGNEPDSKRLHIPSMENGKRTIK